MITMKSCRQNRNDAKVGVGASVEKRRIILASGSSRRRELLEAAGLTFTVDPANISEDMSGRHSAPELVKKLAFEKAAAVAVRHPGAIIIGADTVVAIGKYRWSKPESKKEARMMLRTLSGKTHRVWTGFCIIDTKSGKRIVKAVSSKITLLPLSPKTIERHIATGEALQGAGGYMIQKGGAALIAKVNGDYSNIIGLPLVTVLSELKKFGARM